MNVGAGRMKISDPLFGENRFLCQETILKNGLDKTTKKPENYAYSVQVVLSVHHTLRIPAHRCLGGGPGD